MEGGEILLRQMSLLLSSGFGFVRLSWKELRKYSRARMVALAGILARGVQRKDYKHWGKPGIRAQLLNIKTRKLEMDFVFEGDQRSFHILNEYFFYQRPFSAAHELPFLLILSFGLSCVPSP